MDGRTVFGYIYAYTYAEVKHALTLAKAAAKKTNPMRIIGTGTVAEYLKWWLENIMCEKVKVSTYAQYQERIFHHIIPALGANRVSELTKEQTQQFITVLTDKGLASSTIKNIVGLLRSAMKTAVELHLADVNACEGVIIPSAQTSKRRALSREEQVELEKSASTAGQDVDLGVFLALYTGMRIGEICALRWRDIDLFSGTITVCGTLQRIRIFDDEKQKTKLIEGDPKSKRSQRTIPLPAEFADKLRSYNNSASPDSHVLTGSAKPMEPRALRARFSKVAACSGLSIPFHSLRHTFAARCLEHNFDIQTLSELLGHSTANTTMTVYAHSVMEHKRMLTSRIRVLSEMDKPSNTPSASVSATY